MTDEQVERVARAICIAQGYSPDELADVSSGIGPRLWSESWMAYVREARAAIAAMQPEWQPIETAPKDGRRIVAMRNEQGKDLPSFIHWDEEDGWCGMTANDEKRIAIYQPTHWMPVPPPPAGDKP